MSDQDSDIDEQLQEIAERMDDLRHLGHDRSAIQTAKELRRRAKQFQRVIPYLHANFNLMNCSQATLEPEFGADIAIESIALLESEDRARQIQPDLPQAEYDHFVHWMSACSYDNLARHVAARQGYNSDGVHDCINEGIQVCRRTGKLECVTCFREYATSVYEASDDLEMALHHARAVAATDPGNSGSDRRWVGARDVGWLLTKQGQLDAALKQSLAALARVDSYHSPVNALNLTRLQLETILWLLGRHDEFETIVASVPVEQSVEAIPSGEDPGLELERAKLAALAASCSGDFETAIKLLIEWDQKLTQMKCLDAWFDVRLRLIATSRLAGKNERIEGLARQLEAKAKPARDWHSLRRLKVQLDGSVPLSPFAFLAVPTSGPFSGTPAVLEAGTGAAGTGAAGTGAAGTGAAAAATGTAATPAEAVSEANDSDAASSERDVPESAISPFFDDLHQRWQAAEEREQYAALLDSILAQDPTSELQADDAARLLHLGTVLSPTASAPVDVWQWASRFLTPFAQSATVLNLIAALGHTLRNLCGDDVPAALPTFERIEELFRASFDLDAEQPGGFARAGDFYLDHDRIGDAERCFARSFRLARDNGRVALKLAQIYSDTDRRNDACGVLEMSLREGCQEAAVAWEAGLTAMSVNRHALAVTCLDQYEQLAPDESWTHYYRGLSLLDLDRPDDALAAFDLEAARSPGFPFPVATLRAAAYAVKGDFDRLRSTLDEVLSLPLSGIDYLTAGGLARLFQRLDAAVQVLPDDDPVRSGVEELALACGLATDDFFKRHRKGETQDGLCYFVVEFKQPLDANWSQSRGCLHGQEHWTGYAAIWGVLAPDESQAVELARQWQRRCNPLPAQLQGATLHDDGFNDVAGVVWQRMHEPLDSDGDDE